MGKTNQNIFSTVLSINPYKGTYIASEGQYLKVEKSPQYAKNQYTVSFISTNDFISALIGVSKNIPEEDLGYVIETKVYEELALDMAVEYKINYVEAVNHADEKERFFHIFVIDSLIIEEQFVDAVENVKYIDDIVPLPLLLRSLYEQEIIGDNGVHAYIYFQENDAFITLYDQREFLYTKSLKYSFKEMHERFCELLGEQMPYNDFVSLLSSEGLSTHTSEHQKYLIKLFGELFVHINDIITYTKRAFELEQIDHIYIYSEVGSIIGLDEYCQTYLGLEAQAFDFDYGLQTDGYVDQIHQLMHIYTQSTYEERYISNATIFDRPPPFIQRNSGKLILLSIASLIMGFAVPVYFWTLSYAESINKHLLEQEYAEVHTEMTTRQKIIDLKHLNEKNAMELLTTETDAFNHKKATLTKIRAIKVNYPMKGQILAGLTKDLNRFEVGTSEIEYNENDSIKVFTIELMAKEDKQITNFLEFMTKNRTDKYSFYMEKIYLDEETTSYKAEMKVVLK